jgi:hypothetical protein
MHKLSIIYISIILVLFFFGYYYLRLDDTFIFYKYAKNIADGNGYVFNLGEKVNATTSPLYTLLLASLYWLLNPFINVDFVIIGNLISIISIIIILLSIKKLLNDDLKFSMFAMIFCAMPLIKFGFGMETFLNLALIVYSTYLYANNNLTFASIFAGFSVLARLDSALFAGIILLHYIFTKKRIPPISVMLSFLLVIVPWFIFSKIYFNSYLPTTIGAKLSQNELGLFGPGFIFLTNSIRVLPGGYLTILTILLMVAYSFYYLITKKITVFNNSGLTIIIIWSIALFITYAFVINAPPYQWYYTPFAIVTAILCALTFSHLIITVKTQKIILSLLFLIACVLPVKNIVQGYNPKYINFIRSVDWLNKNAINGSLLAVDDIGILGYHYNKGKLVDALGLINPEVAEHYKRQDYNWFLDHFKPEFIVHEYPRLAKYLQGDEKSFWDIYEVKKVFESRGEKIAIYQKVKSNK